MNKCSIKNYHQGKLHPPEYKQKSSCSIYILLDGARTINTQESAYDGRLPGPAKQAGCGLCACGLTPETPSQAADRREVRSDHQQSPVKSLHFITAARFRTPATLPAILSKLLMVTLKTNP